MLIVTALLLALAAPSCACECSGMTPLNYSDSLSVVGELNIAAVVVVGEVTGADYHGGPIKLDVRYTIRVMQAWKGLTDTAIVVSAGYRGNECGLHLSVGGQYLLYLYREGTLLSSSACSRHLALRDAQKDLGFLGRPTYQATASLK